MEKHNDRFQPSLRHIHNNVHVKHSNKKAFFFESPPFVFPYGNVRRTKSSLVCQMSSQRNVSGCVSSYIRVSVCIYQVHIRFFIYTLKGG